MLIILIHTLYILLQLSILHYYFISIIISDSNKFVHISDKTDECKFREVEKSRDDSSELTLASTIEDKV